MVASIEITFTNRCKGEISSSNYGKEKASKLQDKLAKSGIKSVLKKDLLYELEIEAHDYDEIKKIVKKAANSDAWRIEIKFEE